jgi:hypothetical protein
MSHNAKRASYRHRGATLETRTNDPELDLDFANDLANGLADSVLVQPGLRLGEPTFTGGHDIL